MKIFINPGHMPGVDSGAVNDKYGVTEAGIVKEIGAGVQQYLNRVGYDCLLVQSDNLCGESPNYTNHLCQCQRVAGGSVPVHPLQCGSCRRSPGDGNSGVQQ